MFNFIYEAKLLENNRSNKSVKSNPGHDIKSTKPLEGAHSATKERYIREKYGALLYYDKSKHYKHIETENTPRSQKSLRNTFVEKTPQTPKKQKSLRKFFDRATPEKDKKSLEIQSLCSATVTSTLHSSQSDSQSVFLMPTTSREHAPIHPSGASSVCPTTKGARSQQRASKDRNMRQPDTDGGCSGNNSFNFDAPLDGFGDFNNSQSEQLSHSGRQEVKRTSSMLAKEVKNHTDPRREAFQQSKGSLDFDFENDDDDEDDESANPATTSDNNSQRGMRMSGSSSGVDYRPKLKAAKPAAAPRSGRVGMYSASSRGRSSSRVRDSTSVEPEKQDRCARNGTRTRRYSLTNGMITDGKESASASSRGSGSSRVRDSTSVESEKREGRARSVSRTRNGSVIDGVITKGKESASVSSRGRSSSRVRDSSSVEPEKQEGRRRSVSRTRKDFVIDGVITKGRESARERNASRSNTPREEVPNVSTRGASRTRSGSRTRYGTTPVPPTRASTKPSGRRGRSGGVVKLNGLQDDLNGSSGSLESEKSGNTESSTSRSSSRSSRRHESPVAEKGPTTPASSTRRSRSKNPRERRERSGSRTRISESLEAKAKLLADSRGRLKKEVPRPAVGLSEERKSLNDHLGLGGLTKPTSKGLATKSLQEVLVGSTRTTGGSGDASVGAHSLGAHSLGAHSLGSASRKKASTGDHRPKLRTSLSGPVGGLGRPLRNQEERMKDRRRSAICGKDGKGAKKREGRKSDIFASLDREKETVEMTAGPLMRQLPSRSKSDAIDRVARPLILRQGPTRSEFTGPVFGAGSGNTLRRGTTNTREV